MTVEEVAIRVQTIREIAADYEAAHSMEDALWGDVLRAIADGLCADPAALAKAALATGEVDFARYCA